MLDAAASAGVCK